MTDINEIFTPKPSADITADLIEWVRGSTDKLTDFNVGGVTRTLLEAHAEELDDYYQAIYFGLLKAIPTAIYTGFGFDIQPAVAATGEVVFSRVNDSVESVTIPAGTVLLANNGQRFVTLSACLLELGQPSVSAMVRALVAGAAGNVQANTMSLESTNLGLVTATNPLAMGGGVDAETEDHRAERFAAFVRSLARGTITSLQYIAGIPAMTTDDGTVIERVQRQSVFEEPGHVMLYVDNGAWGISDDLLAKVQLAVDGYRDANTLQWVGGYRPAGMRVEVVPMSRQAFNVSLEVRRSELVSAAAVESELALRMATFLAGVLPLQTLRMIDLINVALSVTGVNAVTVLSPSANIDVPSNTILYLNTLDIQWIE